MSFSVPTWTASPRPTVERTVLVALVLLSCLGLVLFQPFVFPLDDAYITLGNARTLVSGGVDSFGSTPLVGATSPLQLILLALLGSLVGFLEASYIINAAAMVLYGYGLARLSVLGKNSASFTVCVVIIGLLAVDAPYHLFNGLETGLAMAGTVWAIIWALQGARLPLAILCGLLPFIRPELLALGGCLGLFFAYQNRTHLPRVLVFAAMSALVATPFLIWSWVETGSLTPLTSSAKKAFFAEGFLPWGEKTIWVVMIVLASGLAPLFFGFVLLRKSALAPPLFLYLAAFFLAYMISFPGGLSHNHYRYLYVLVPIALAGWVLAANANIRLRAAIVPLTIWYLLYGGFYSWHNVVDGRAFTAELDQTAEWVNENLPAGSRILIHDAGYISWATDFDLIDLVGLKTPQSIAAHEKYTLPSGGAEVSKAINQIATNSDPDYAIILNDDFWGSIAQALKAEGWSLDSLRHPDGRGYIVYRLNNMDEGRP